MKTTAAPDPNTRTPEFRPPALACDAHCHVFGPAAKFPFAPDASYHPPDSPFEGLQKLHKILGLERAVIVPRNHGLLKMRRITLKALARFALVTYDAAFTGHHYIMAAFEHTGLKPKVVLSASDADVIKACIEQGFGVGVMLGIAFDRQRDKGLCAIPAGHLFQPATISVLLNRRHYLRKYGYHFVEIFAERWTRASIETAFAR